MTNEEFEKLQALFEPLAADVRAMRAELSTVAERVEVIAVEQARLADEMGRMREDMNATGRRVGRVEESNSDQWQAINRLAERVRVLEAQRGGENAAH